MSHSDMDVDSAHYEVSTTNLMLEENLNSETFTKDACALGHENQSQGIETVRSGISCAPLEVHNLSGPQYLYLQDGIPEAWLCLFLRGVEKFQGAGISD